jgi:phosphomannomutase
MPGKIFFGTDGWRGIIDKDITNKAVAEAAQAFAEYLKNNIVHSGQLKAAVSHDGRTHSRPWALLISRVLSGNNIVVYLSDKITPTPLLSFYVKEKKLDAGVMVTASHNSAEFNGIKFKASYGGPFSSEEIHKIESLVGSELVQADDEKIYQTDLWSVYNEYLEREINFKLIEKAGLNILADSMAGSGQQLLESLFIKHSIKCKTIYKIAEKDFGGRKPEPLEQNLQPLKAELLKDDYSFGIATDGDADRLGVMMENGEWLNPQELILLFADYVINKKEIKGNIVKTSSVTDKLRKFFASETRKVIDTEVGFKNLTKHMITEDVAFACEESGGFTVKNHIPDKDGLYSGLLLAEMLASSGFKKLSDYVEAKRKIYGKIHYGRLDVPCDIEQGNLIINRLHSSPPEKTGSYSITSFKVFYNNHGGLNGIKFSFADSCQWLLLRTSETEPLVRIYAEGENEEQVKEFIAHGKSILNITK